MRRSCRPFLRWTGGPSEWLPVPETWCNGADAVDGDVGDAGDADVSKVKGNVKGVKIEVKVIF